MTKSPRVLIVEDDAWLAAEYQRTLRAAGFLAVHVAHGLAAIDEIDHARPDAVVLDLFLPGPNGLALLHEIRSHHDLATIPIVMVTNAVDMVVAEDVQVYGVVALLDKSSMQPDDIARAVRKSLL